MNKNESCLYTECLNADIQIQPDSIGQKNQSPEKNVLNYLHLLHLLHGQVKFDVAGVASAARKNIFFRDFYYSVFRKYFLQGDFCMNYQTSNQVLQRKIALIT